jgi:hypothetical protein
MLTEGALFFLNLCNEYRDIREAKRTSGVSETLLKQNKSTSAAKRQRHFPEDSDDDAPSAASRSTKKRILTTSVGVTSHGQALPSKRSRKASTSEKVSDKEPMEVQTSCRYGGLEDEDDEEEWQAVKQSPIKAKGVRISNHVRRSYVRLLTRC